MIEYNYFVKIIQKTNLIINRLIKKNLNKLNSTNFYTLTKSNKFLLSSVVLIVLLLSYLSIPNIYNKPKISKKINDQLKKKV